MSLLGKPSPKKNILLMKVYVSCPEKMFMFWGHDGDLFATSVIKRDMGDVKTHFWNQVLPGSIMYIYCTKMSTSALNVANIVLIS